MLAQVKVNVREGQTYVFISIILHNNTGCYFFWAGDNKRENRCNKRSPGGRHPYLEKCLFISQDLKHMWSAGVEQLKLQL